MHYYSFLKQCSYAALLLYLILFYSVKIYAQRNLVVNSSFEQYTNCPNGGRYNHPDNWYPPDNGTSPYFNACAQIGYGNVPYTYFGYQNAHSGVAMIGILLWQNTNKSNNYTSSYLQSKLNNSLLKGKKYYAEFYCISYKFTKYYSNNLSMLFTDTTIYADTITPPYSNIILANAQVYSFGNPVINDTINWVKINGVFTANGGEQFITIGNFRYRSQTTAINKSTQYYDWASYYIDDISVIPLDSMQLQADAGRDTVINKGDSAWIGSYTNGIDTLKWLQNGVTVIDSTRPGFWVYPTTNTYYVLTQTVNEYTSRDTVWVTVNPLPLQFISYSVFVVKENSVENKWTTANEVNVHHYIVEKSNDGTNFNSIRTIKAENKQVNEYEFVEKNVSTGVNYYRIVGVDNDGRKTYSEVKETNLFSNKEISIYPNPSKDFVNVVGSNIKQVIISDISGRVLLKSTEKKIDIRSLVSGVYYVVIETLNGNHVTKKLIKLP